MSYLDAPRIHFFGGYFANPSTINNNLTNYDLKPPLDLSWNPDVSAFFRFRDCAVRSAVGHDGAVSAGDAGDPITRATVTTPQAPQPKVAKIVDLDPDQQTITQLYGVIVTVALPGGKGGVTGRMAVAELRDLWFARVPGTDAGSDGAASGVWQSVLTELQWSGLEQSALLRELHEASPDWLSIKFNCDAYDDDAQSPTFNQGRLAGTIGPAFPGEPAQFVMGLRLIPALNAPYWPAPFQVSRGGDRLVIDLGNSMPLESAGGEVSGPSSLEAVILGPDGPMALSGPIDASNAAYAVNAGVCEVPVSAEQRAILKGNPLGLVAAGDTTLLLNEPLDGRYVNVEPFSLRLDPGQSATVTLHAREFGEPRGGLELPIGFDCQSQFDHANSPPAALRFPRTVTTGPSGEAPIEIATGPPRPLPDRRSSIDSQVYFLGGEWESWGQISGSSQAAISVLVFNDAPPKDNPTLADVQPVLNQYAVPYPGMTRRLDLSSYEAVSGSSAEVLEVISLPIDDPAHMPVTRDLSASRRLPIQTWIKNGCPEGEGDA
jgi:hypothetical protein